MVFNILIDSALSAQDKFIFIVAFIGAAMFAIMVHEYAHAWVAYKNGDMTAKFAGRMNLNPRSHFDLLGLLMFFFIGFGWAKPVPINSDNFVNKKKGIFTTAIAGVTMNLIVAFIAFAFMNLLLLIPDNFIMSNNFVYILFILLYYFFYISMLINISLIAFNILPIYPLDGFRMVEAFAKPTNPYVKFMYNYGSYILLGLILFSRFLPGNADIFGLYFRSIQNFISYLFQAIWGKVFGAWI